MSEPSGSAPSNLDVRIRAATLSDIPEILHQRRGMYEDMNYQDAEALATMVSVSSGFLAEAITDGSFRAWLALVEGTVAGGGAVLISPWPAHPYDLQCRRATILNIYTYPQYRRRGVARRMMQTVLDWCRNEGLARITLHASDNGRALYESLGFEASNEMRLDLK
jgi:ribosomal protein S18 acetylase RimI-like enzyme